MSSRMLYRSRHICAEDTRPCRAWKLGHSRKCETHQQLDFTTLKCVTALKACGAGRGARPCCDSTWEGSFTTSSRNELTAPAPACRAQQTGRTSVWSSLIPCARISHGNISSVASRGVDEQDLSPEYEQFEHNVSDASARAT